MPRKNPEHGARLEIRLPAAMLDALKWTAKHERLPLSDWARNVLQGQCLSVAAVMGEEILSANAGTGLYEVKVATLLSGSKDRRPATGKYDESTLVWRGGRHEKTTSHRVYTDLDGGAHLGSLPDKAEQMRQDLYIDRAEARRELRSWLNRWGRPRKTLRLSGDQLRLAQRLLATFDNDDPE